MERSYVEELGYFLITRSSFEGLLELFEQAFFQNIAGTEFIEGGREDVGMLVLRASRVRHHFFQHLKIFFMKVTKTFKIKDFKTILALYGYFGGRLLVFGFLSLDLGCLLQ